MGKGNKRRRTQLAGKPSQVSSKEKEEKKLTTKTKKINPPQVEKPTEEKFLSSKDLAGMAGVEPRLLRRCLRKDFASRITTVKGGNGLKTYHIKADDPVVPEIIAKLKGNGDKGKVAAKAEVKVTKPEAKLTKKQKAKEVK